MTTEPLTITKQEETAGRDVLVTDLPPLRRAKLDLQHPTEPGKSMRGTLSERPDGAWELQLQRLSVTVPGSRVPLQIHIVAETREGAAEIFQALARAIGEGAV